AKTQALPFDDKASERICYLMILIIFITMVAVLGSDSIDLPTPSICLRSIFLCAPLFLQCQFDILAAVEYTEDSHGLIINSESNRYAAPKTDYSQTGQYVIPPGASMRKVSKPSQHSKIARTKPSALRGADFSAMKRYSASSWPSARFE
ncbi:MAG: hypothetical protein L0Y43_06190, partial [Methylococcaceae bacterium]|nr:hypothetical protein [Methylococcaceae bacterium]